MIHECTVWPEWDKFLHIGMIKGIFKKNSQKTFARKVETSVEAFSGSVASSTPGGKVGPQSQNFYIGMCREKSFKNFLVDLMLKNVPKLKKKSAKLYRYFHT